MKSLKKLGVAEMDAREQRKMDGGVVMDENGKGCTEHGFPSIWDILIKKGTTGPYNPGAKDL